MQSRPSPKLSIRQDALLYRRFFTWVALLLLFALPVTAIIGVTLQQWRASSPSRGPAVAATRSSSARNVAHQFDPRRALWLATALRSETDALVADPGDPAHLFAGTTAGLWTSRDYGATWQPERSGPGSAILSFAVAPGHPGLFAGDGDGFVYQWSPRQAARWRRISPSLGGVPIFSLAASATASPVLLAGTSGTLYRGVQIGTRWQWQHVASTGASSVTSILWDSRAAGHAYASVFGSWPPVLRTTDGGRTWRPDAAGLPSSLPSQALITTGGPQPQVVLSTMGGGVWQRLPQGTWREISAGLPERHAMPLATSGGVLYGGTMGYGVYLREGAAGWRRIGNGLVGGQYIVLSLLVTPGPHPYLVAGTAQGVYRCALFS